MIGTKVFLIISIRAPSPPLSFALTPSTSSMMMTDLFLKAVLFSPYLTIDDDVQVSLRSVSIVFLDRLSLALNSRTLNPSSYATIFAEDDFPIPGGPDNMQAFALILGKSA
jgi:hypothetical protein